MTRRDFDYDLLARAIVYGCAALGVAYPILIFFRVIE